MSLLTRGLLLLILSPTATTTTGGIVLGRSCLEGYTRISSPQLDLCVLVTPRGTWLEGFSMCALPENPSYLYSLANTNIANINLYLRQLGVSEVWLWPSDYKPPDRWIAFNQDSITELDKLFYSFHISRLKWSTSSKNECKTWSCSTFNQSERSCSPEASLKLPFVCVLPLEYESETVPLYDECVDGAFRGFQHYALDVCFFTDDEETEKLARKDYSLSGLKGRNYSHCEWLRKGINPTELEERISNECQQRQTKGQTTVDGSRYNKPVVLKPTVKEAPKVRSFSERITDTVADILWEIGKKKGLYNGRRKKQELSIFLPGPESPSGNGCVLCPPFPVDGALSPLLRLTLIQPDATGSLSFHGENERVNWLSLTLLNYNSSETEEVTCYTDASVSNFTSPNYKVIKISISALDKKTHTRRLTLRKTAIEDGFFLRLRHNNLDTPIQDLEIETELAKFNEGHNEKTTFITIPFEVLDEGNYWCAGRDYITKRPIFTESVLVEIPLEEKLQRYLVLVETPRKYDSTLYCQNFSTVMARNLNISDANIELKRIISKKQSHHLLYHVTLQQNHTQFLAGSLPKKFHFYVENTDHEFATITSILKFSSVCPTTTMNSARQFPVNLTSTMKGRPPEVVGVHLNGSFVNAVYACVGDAVDGAVWKEITPGDKGWKKEWNVSRPLGSIATELHTMSDNPIKSNQLPKVTDIIKVLLNQGEGSAANNKQELEDLDTILSTLIFDPMEGVKIVCSSEVAILVSDLSRENPVVGISLTTKNGTDTIEGITDILAAGNSDVMVSLPPAITANYKRLAFTVFSNVQSFHSNTSTIRVNSRIVGIVLSSPGKIPDHTKLPDGQMVEIYFKPTFKVQDSERASCAFWDLQNAVWSTEGCLLERSTNICRCNHLTHFAQIITGSGARLSSGHQKALEVISILGCTLSLLGLLVIVATGVVFKAWRQEVGNQVLLNLTAALTLNLVTFLLVHTGVGGNEGGGCIFTGVVLHYSVLACFCWMLVMSGLQLTRLLTIVGNRNTSKLLLKSSLFAWGVPFIPIAILLIISPSLYAPTTDNSIERGFCYPTGAAFYATVLAPVVCIIIVNMVAYIAILCRLFSCCGWGELKTGIQRHGLSDGVIAMRRIRILVFLFFLFGLTWTFAFLAKYIFFAYLFCITATLQGFVIFVFFFVIERRSRSYWNVEFCQIPGKRNYKSSETFSSVTYSTATQKTSGGKSSWYVENAPLQNKEKGSTVRIRSKEGSEACLSQEEEPLKLRFSQQNMTPPEEFSEPYTDLVPLKRVSFEVQEHKTAIPQNKGLTGLTLKDTKNLDGKTMETMDESAKIQLSVEIKMPNLPDNEEDAIEQDPGKIASYTDSPMRVSFEDDERLEVKPIISQTDVLKGSKLKDALKAGKEILENRNKSLVISQSLLEVKIPNLPGNKDVCYFNTSEKYSESIASSSSGSSSRESPKVKIKILQEKGSGLPVSNDNVTVVGVESNQNQENRTQAVSEIQPKSNMSLENQTPTHNAESVQIPREETISSVISIKKEPVASISTLTSSDSKVIGPTNPTKRSPFVVSCPITRH